MPPKKSSKADKEKGKKRKRSASGEENGVESLAPEITVDVATAPIRLADVISVPMTSVDSPVGEETAEKKSRDKKAEEKKKKAAEKKKLVDEENRKKKYAMMFDPKHPFYYEFKDIESGTGLELSSRQLGILCRKDMDPKARHRRATLYFATNGLIFFKYGPNRRAPRIKKDGTMTPLNDRFDLKNLPNEVFEGLGMTRDDMPAFASGGTKKKKVDKLLAEEEKAAMIGDGDVEMTEAGDAENAGEEPENDGNTTIDDPENEEEERRILLAELEAYDAAYAATILASEETHEAWQLKRFIEIDIGEGSFNSKDEQDKEKEISRDAQKIDPPSAGANNPSPLQVRWVPEWDTQVFKDSTRKGTVGEMRRSERAERFMWIMDPGAVFRPRGMTYKEFITQVHDCISLQSPLRHLPDSRRVMPHLMEFFIDEDGNGNFTSFELVPGDQESLTKAVDAINDLPQLQRHLKVGLDMVSDIAFAMMGIGELDVSGEDEALYDNGDPVQDSV